MTSWTNMQRRRLMWRRTNNVEVDKHAEETADVEEEGE